MENFKFKKWKSKRNTHLTADDVPPAAPWTAARKSRRNYYYDMYDSSNYLEKMATPFDNIENPQHEGKRQTELTSSLGDLKKSMPHCKACTDFKTWIELTANPRRHMPKEEREEKQCPPDSELLGNNTWSFLHTMAAYYPSKPSFEQQHNMKSFITLMSQFYPCHVCAAHLREDLKQNLPDTTNNVNLSRWFCQLHNRVNERLGKPTFDCSKVLERWRDGWADNSCD